MRGVWFETPKEKDAMSSSFGQQGGFEGTKEE